MSDATPADDDEVTANDFRRAAAEIRESEAQRSAAIAAAEQAADAVLDEPDRR